MPWLSLQIIYLDCHKLLIILLLIALVLVCSVYYLIYSTTTLSSFPTALHNNSCCKNQIFGSCPETCNRLIGVRIDNKLLSYNTFPPDKNRTKTISFKKRGFIVVSKYSEQQMGAAMNLLTLCKWAKYVRVSPVEPYVAESTFRLPARLSQSILSHELRFRDYFNITHWNKLSPQYGAARLVSWGTFLRLKPRKMIFVIVLCDRHVQEPNFLFTDYKIFEDSECKNSYSEFMKKHKDNMDHVLRLQMVRSVCMKLYSSVLHVSEFTKHIYGEFKPSEVVIWVHKWTGILEHSRIRIHEQAFHRTADTFKMISTSERILQDSKMYVEQVLKSHFGSYIGVSFRSARRARFLDKSKHARFFESCIKQLEKIVNFAITNSSESKVFFAQDLGRFGDTVADKYMSDEFMRTVQDSSFKAVYNGTITMREWEQSFVNITNGITDSGYIAAMQSTILKNSKCIIMFGGMSNFQGSILYGYKQKHLNGNACIYEVCYKEHKYV